MLHASLVIAFALSPVSALGASTASAPAKPVVPVRVAVSPRHSGPVPKQGRAHSVLGGAPPLRCLTADAPPPRLPARLPVGTETIHRDAQKIITIHLPVAPEGSGEFQRAKILDTNSKKAREPWPERFALSDGTVFSAFVGVDRAPGSRLDLCVAELLGKGRVSGKPEALLGFLQRGLQADYLREPARDYRFPWDAPPADKAGKAAAEAKAAELREQFLAVKDAPVGQYPVRSRHGHPVAPLEDFLREGRGTCLHKAVLASLILEKAGLPHRVVNGATRKTGHVWIELEDGRVLDPSLGKLASRTPAKSLPGWSSYGGDVFVFENQVWPYLTW